MDSRRQASVPRERKAPKRIRPNLELINRRDVFVGRATTTATTLMITTMNVLGAVAFAADAEILLRPRKNIPRGTERGCEGVRLLPRARTRTIAAGDGFWHSARLLCLIPLQQRRRPTILHESQWNPAWTESGTRNGKCKR
jgi:hypothetical protein